VCQADKAGLPCFTEVADEAKLAVLTRAGFASVGTMTLFGATVHLLLRGAKQ
jgi:hypothetical protein